MTEAVLAAVALFLVAALWLVLFEGLADEAQEDQGDVLRGPQDER